MSRKKTAIAPGQNPKAFSMTAADLEKLAAKMDQLPEAPRTIVNSRMAAIIMLQPQIEGMRAKGYDFVQISEWLAANAPLSVSPSTIRTALSKARGDERPPKRKSAKAARTISEPPQSPPLTPRVDQKPDVKPVEQPGFFSTGDDSI